LLFLFFLSLFFGSRCILQLWFWLLLPLERKAPDLPWIHGVFLVVAACGATLGRIQDFVYCCVCHSKLILRCTTLCKKFFFLNPQSSSSTQISKTITHSLTHLHYDENKKIQQLIAQIWMGPNNKLLDVRISQDLVYLVIEEEEAEKNLL